MICKKCGADIGNKGKCEYCDTVYFEAFQQQNAQPGKKKTTKQENRKKDKSGKTKAKITFPTKVAMVFWFMCCMANLPEIESIGYSQYMWVAILGFLFFGGITQLISANYNKRHKADQEKKAKPRTKLTLATKIVVAIFLLCSIVILPAVIATKSYYQYVWIVMIGIFFYGGITQLISSALKRQNISDHSEQTAQSQIRNADLSSKPYDHMDIPEFELFCCDILEKNGFAGISITKFPEDQGIDIIAFKNGTRYGIRCKCGASIIGIATVQKVLAGKKYFECQIAAIMTNQYFAQDAKVLAEREEILLWDRDRLNRFISDN